jgi:hypothetical protein
VGEDFDDKVNAFDHIVFLFLAAAALTVGDRGSDSSSRPVSGPGCDPPPSSRIVEKSYAMMFLVVVVFCPVLREE